jgi:hypothetical protein
MVAISGREEEQEEALCCDGGARKILEGKEAEDRGESRSSVSEVCPSTEQIEGVTVTAAVVTATFFGHSSSDFAPPFSSRRAGTGLVHGKFFFCAASSKEKKLIEFPESRKR